MEETADEVLTGADETKVRVDVTGAAEIDEMVREEVLAGKEEIDVVRTGVAERMVREEVGAEEMEEKREAETGLEAERGREAVLLGMEENREAEVVVREAVVTGAETTVLADPSPLLLDDPPNEVETVFLMNGVSWLMMEPTRSESLEVDEETTFETTCSTAGRPRILTKFSWTFLVSV